mmetsp:Transcript_40994/g.112739  ORF Transcript_40994/g.112739 Transcript_40994/m.112739 type:complete len:856 (-) Transcript_40994:55-2622(-)
MGNKLLAACAEPKIDHCGSVHEFAPIPPDGYAAHAAASQPLCVQPPEVPLMAVAPQLSSPPGTFWEAADGYGSAEQLLALLVRDSQGRWQDAAFPPGQSSLCYDWGKHPRAADWKRLAWAEYASTSSNGAVFSAAGAQPCDIQQGMLGDCYFLAALSALADTHKELVERMVVSSPVGLRAGVSIVRLNWNGHWLCVPVSHSFPSLPGAMHGPPRPAFSSARQSGGLWVALAEKAWAKVHGSYQAIEGGALSGALRDLTGAPSRMHSLEFGAAGVREWLTRMASATVGFFQALFTTRRRAVEEHAGRQKELDSAASVWRAMVEASQQRFAMCASCGRSGDTEHLDADTGLVRGHAYTVLDVWDANSGIECLVRLRNPWGRGRWKGAYADRDPRLTFPALRSHSLQEEDDLEDEGIFWMSYADFCANFSSVDICRVRRGYISSSIDLSFPCTADRSLMHEAVVLKVAAYGGTSESETSLSVLQPLFPGALPSESDSKYAGAGLELFEVQGSKAAHLAVSQFATRREVSLHMPLSPGRIYVAVLHWHSQPQASCNANMRVEESVCLRAYSPGPVGLDVFRGDAAALRYAAYSAAARGPESERLWAQCGAQLRCWHDAENHITVLLFDAGSSHAGLAVTTHWKLTGVLLQGRFPEEALPADVAAARSGQKFERDQALQLQRGEEQIAVLTWFDASQGCSVGYSYAASALGCLECGEPVGTAVPGRFSGGLIKIDQNHAAGNGLVHVECSAAFNLRHAAPCLHCGQPVANVPGKFQGSYFSYQENDLGPHPVGKVHTECDVEWRRRWAQPCAHCGGPLMRLEGVYSGKSFVYESAGISGGRAQVHEECNEAFGSRSHTRT